MASDLRDAADTSGGWLTTRTLVASVALASVAATVAVVAIPPLHFAYRNPRLHIALETAEALIGLLAASLVLGRFQRRRRLEDLLLLAALMVLALSNLLFSTAPAVLGTGTSVFSNWTALVARLVGAGLFAAAALAPERRVRLGVRRQVGLGVAVLAVLGCVAAIVGVLEDSLPRGVETVRPEESGRPRLEGHWSVLGAQLAGLMLYAVAAAGFVRRFRRSPDPLLRWLAIGAVLSAAARLNYFLYPSLFTDWVYVGDLFRLSFYLVILIAAGHEIRSHWRGAAETAALEERRRIARDLHDGLAQELASVKRNLGWLDPEDDSVQRASASADRALTQARRAILALSDGRSAPLADALGEVARTVAEREGTRVVLSLEPVPDVEPAEREALILIASEAITNAARHGRSELVRVELCGGRRIRLRIRDFGCGFDLAAQGNGYHGGMGLTGMRQRAEAVGAELRIESRRGAGTAVEVVL